MIVDTSALVAIFAEEPERALFTTILHRSSRSLVSGGSWIELGTVLVRRFGATDPSPVLDRLIGVFGLTVEPVTTRHVRLAVEAYRTFGRGTKHEAGLNFGGCFAYALAKATGESLLFKGEDFGNTDIKSAL